MLKKIFSLSDKGLSNLYGAVSRFSLHNLSIMFPVILLIMVTKDLIGGSFLLEHGLLRFFGYTVVSFILLLAIYLIYKSAYRKMYIAAYKESANTRVNLAEKIRVLPLSYFGKKDLSDLTSTLMDDTATIEHTLATGVPELIGAVFSSSIVLLLLFILNWKMSCGLFACFPVALGFIIISRWLSSSSNLNNRNAKLDVSQGVQEFLDNIKVIHSSPKRDVYRDGIEKKIKRVVKTSMIYELVMGLFLSSAYNILRVGLGVVVVVGAYLISHNGINATTYLFFLFVASRIYDPLTTAFFKSGELFYSFVAASRIREVYDYPVQKGNTEKKPSFYDIEFDSVSFAYEDKLVIKDLSFTAKQGEITALVGPSGSGKSTVTRLACRFFDVLSGKISLGGINIKGTNPEILLGNFSIVFQDVVLFNDSVFNNIKIGRKDATKEEIIAAAKMARCHDFIEKLPEGYKTIIGENGKKLSGGERQRISIARAFLKDAPVILLDEATASLDPENETLIQEAIGKLIKDKTVLVIAHRLRSVEYCDKIVVLKNGRVHETGTHKALMETEGLYNRLFNLQRESARWNVGSKTGEQSPTS